MFAGAPNLNFNNNSFTVNVGTAQRNQLGPLFDCVSPNAILNAGGRADEVRCYPGTREEIIRKIERWVDGQSQPDHRMLWLSGHAGAGKSAIAQTVAERSAAHRGVDTASFFFFRGDNTRSHARPLVATFVYQLIRFYPGLHEHLADALKAQPLAFMASVEEQFAQLLASPIERICHSSAMNQKIVLIIDGLDECSDEEAQLQILGALHTLVSRGGSPFRVFIASRTEPHLVIFFDKIADSVEPLFLNDEYRPADDIRKFVIAKFNEIKQTHHLRDTFSGNWPAEEDIHKIVNKSSGQFMYAATVMRYIGYSPQSPALSLLSVLGLRPLTRHNPFAPLDALYSHVFSKARDTRAIRWSIWLHSRNFFSQSGKLLQIAGYNATSLESLFADLSTIAKISINQNGSVDIDFYHPSLLDFLEDQSRSGVYHIDTDKMPTEISTICFQQFHDTDTFNLAVHVLRLVKVPASMLSESLSNASQRKFDHGFKRPTSWNAFIRIITQLYFTTDTALCGRILRGWIRFAYTHKFDPSFDGFDLNRAASRYYEFLRLTEKAKFYLGID